MVKKFATGIQESWLYIPTTSAELSILSWSFFLWFLIPAILPLFWFFAAPPFSSFTLSLSLFLPLAGWPRWRPEPSLATTGRRGAASPPSPFSLSDLSLSLFPLSFSLSPPFPLFGVAGGHPCLRRSRRPAQHPAPPWLQPGSGRASPGCWLGLCMGKGRQPPYTLSLYLSLYLSSLSIRTLSLPLACSHSHFFWVVIHHPHGHPLWCKTSNPDHCLDQFLGMELGMMTWP